MCYLPIAIATATTPPPPAEIAPQWMPPPPAGGWEHHTPQAPADPDPGGRLLSRRAIVLVGIAIALGGLMQLAGVLLARSSVSDDALVRDEIIMNLAFYAVVAVMIVSQITPNVRLRWGKGPLPRRIAFGTSIGVGLGALLLFVGRVAAGHVITDPRLVRLMNGGDLLPIVVMVALVCITGPLVEEILFRGLLLESLRPRGVVTAITVSAVAFAVWHFLPASLLYYGVMGVGFGRLYIQRGLTTSLSAHVGFNSVLAAAAVAAVVGPGTTVHADGLSLKMPSGWSQLALAADHPASVVLDLGGPAGSEVAVKTLAVFEPAALADALRSSSDSYIPGVSFYPETVRETELPTVGTAVEANFASEGEDGELVAFALDGRAYGMLFINGGSARAEADFTKMLGSLARD